MERPGYFGGIASVLKKYELILALREQRKRHIPLKVRSGNRAGLRKIPQVDPSGAGINSRNRSSGEDADPCVFLPFFPPDMQFC